MRIAESTGIYAPGRSPRDVVALINLVSEGLPYAELLALQTDLGLPLDKLAAHLGIPRATLHRRQKAGTLSPEESDRILRFRRLLDQAAEIFGSTGAAADWLRAPQWGLGEVTPLEFARTEVGSREVERLLLRLDYGVLA